MINNPKVVLELNNVHFKYQEVKKWNLKDINLKITKGSFNIITGPTGSGKSTLLKIMRGFNKIEKGKLFGNIYLFGKELSYYSIEDIGKFIGIIFQNPSTQIHQMSVIEEIISGPLYQGNSWLESKEIGEYILKQFFDISYYNKNPINLSYGEMQKVALAACLSMKCEILLLDEPFSFLDFNEIKKLIEFLLLLKQQGKTIIVATHEIEHFLNFADQIILLNKGNIILKDTPQNIFYKYSKTYNEVLELPLFINISIALKKRGKLNKNILCWLDLFKNIKINKKPYYKNKKKLNQNIILSIKNLLFKYRNSSKTVQIDYLDVYKGEIFGIIGKNGSGKTTLAKLIVGLLRPIQGKIIFLDQELNNMPVNKRAKYIGFITQDPNEMLFEQTVWDECAFGAKIAGKQNYNCLVKNTLKMLNLFEYYNKDPESLSGGEKRLLTIGDILVNQPNILILDEPEFGLDKISWGNIEEIIIKLKKQGKSVIVITHNIEIALFLCNRIALIDEGKIAKIGTPLQLFKNEKLLKKYNFSSIPLLSAIKLVNQEKVLSNRENFMKYLIEQTQ